MRLFVIKVIDDDVFCRDAIYRVSNIGRLPTLVRRHMSRARSARAIFETKIIVRLYDYVKRQGFIFLLTYF